MPEDRAPCRRAAGAVVACGLALTLCVARWALTGDQTRAVPAHLATFGLAFAAYGVALHFAGALGPTALRAALAAAVIWRMALVPAPPLLSDDIYRYVWEGRIQLHGGNPYRWADRPAADKWAALRDPVWAAVTHKDYTAVYPPLWQVTARAVAAVQESVAAFKALAVAAELATWALLASVLRRRALPPHRLMLLAWSPLALVEIAGSGHNDATGLFWLTAALLAVERGQGSLAALLCGLGAWVKLLPGVVAVSWLRRLRPPGVLAAAVACALLLLPYASAREGLVRSLGSYSRYWRFNETLFAPLALALGGQERAGPAALALLLALALALAWRGVEPAGAALAVVAAYLLLAANVLPWYALWLLPLLVLRPEPGALLFTGTVQLAYLVYPAWLSGERWAVGWDVRALEYGPCLLLAAGSAWRRRAAAQP